MTYIFSPNMMRYVLRNCEKEAYPEGAPKYTLKLALALVNASYKILVYGVRSCSGCVIACKSACC